MMTVKYFPFFSFFLTIGDLISISFYQKFSYEDDMFRRIDEFITSRGFVNENHTVVTKDKYKLSVNRMVNPFAQSSLGVHLEPVLLVHGVFGSGAQWLFNEPDGHMKSWKGNKRPIVNDNSLAFLLANCGFDVWILNVRGTSYSRSHAFLDPDKDQEYWNFSYPEIAKYDITASIDYILNITRKDNLIYIGFSQGTILMFSLLSMKPEYNKKLKLFIAIAPVTNCNQVKGLPAVISTYYKGYTRTGVTNCEVPIIKMLRPLSFICSNPIFRSMCLLTEGISGSYMNYNHSRLPVYLNHIDTTSCKSLQHELQLIQNGQLQLFNYGPEQNLIKYNSTEPPILNITQIPANNIIIISSTGDKTSAPEDVENLKKTLKGKPLHHLLINDNNWSHSSFMRSPTLYNTMGQFIIQYIDQFLDSQ